MTLLDQRGNFPVTAVKSVPMLRTDSDRMLKTMLVQQLQIQVYTLYRCYLTLRQQHVMFYP